MRWLLPGAVLAVAAVVILAMALTMSSRSATDVTDLEVGDCFDLDIDRGADTEFVELTLVEPIECAEPHNAQVVATRDLNPDHDLPYPGDDRLLVDADRICRDFAAADDRFGVVPITPTEATWDARRGRTLCVAVSYGAVPIEGDHLLLRGTSAPDES